MIAPAPRFRPAREADLAGIEAGERRYIQEIEPDAQAAWDSALARNREVWRSHLDRTVVAEIAGDFAGYAMWGRDGGVATLLTVHVVPAFRSHGLGSALIERFVADAAADGGTELRLGVHRRNPARRRYEAAGFTLLGEDGEYLLFGRPAVLAGHPGGAG